MIGIQCVGGRFINIVGDVTPKSRVTIATSLKTSLSRVYLSDNILVILLHPVTVTQRSL